MERRDRGGTEAGAPPAAAWLDSVRPAHVPLTSLAASEPSRLFWREVLPVCAPLRVGSVWTCRPAALARRGGGSGCGERDDLVRDDRPPATADGGQIYQLDSRLDSRHSC